MSIKSKQLAEPSRPPMQEAYENINQTHGRPDVEQKKRQVPTNELDLQLQLTDPTWQNIAPELREKLIKILETRIENNKVTKVYEELAGVLQIYTKDIRLGNLSPGNGEYDWVIYFLDLSVDMLLAGYPTASVTALNKALSRLETSSSKQGFLRKMFNTFFKYDHHTGGGLEKQSPLAGKKLY